jgi:catechol 2,3-dioxygenase-like lactoylglutathione lyase family enzyme
MAILKNLFHLSVQTNDYDEVLKFYCETLGFDYMYGYKIGDFKTMLHMDEAGNPDDNDKEWLCYIRCAPEEYIEVFNKVVNPPEFSFENIDDEGSKVLHSYALGCADVEKTKAALEAKGVVFENGYMSDPSGIKIKLVQRDWNKNAKNEHLINGLAGVSIYVNDLEYMAEYLEKMGMKIVSKTESAVKAVLGENEQYIELIQSPTPVLNVADGVLGHIALQVNSISDAVYEWGKAGVRCCMHAMMKDNPFPVEPGIKGNIAVDHNEIVWNVSEEGNRFEIMYQPGDTEQQKFERKNPF